jgi:probable rRNA maturation factor
LQVASDNDFIPDTSIFIKLIKKISQHIDIIQKNVTVRLVDEPESQALNKQFRGKDSPTNVLSFPGELPADIDPDYLGDIVICAPVVEREALEHNKVVDAHWAHMLLHGILHLKGYDHNHAAEALEMEALETKILAAMGYSDPYVEPL